MITPLDKARKRLAEIQAEAAEIQRFIDMYERFSDGTKADHAEAPPLSAAEDTNPGSTTKQPVDNSKKSARRRGPGPDAIAQMIERVIREVGQPMTRGQLVEALEVRDVELPALDKPRYLGTIIWRHKSIFVNIEGRGYWLRDEPLPKPVNLFD